MLKKFLWLKAGAKHKGFKGLVPGPERGKTSEIEHKIEVIMNARNTGLGKTVGQPLERNEMQNILAGFTPHECNCYCCDGEEQLDTPIMHLEGAGCDAGGGVESHQACKDACETSGFVTNMCDNNGGEICALCESDDYPG